MQNNIKIEKILIGENIKRLEYNEREPKRKIKKYYQHQRIENIYNGKELNY